MPKHSEVLALPLRARGTRRIKKPADSGAAEAVQRLLKHLFRLRLGSWMVAVDAVGK